MSNPIGSKGVALPGVAPFPFQRLSRPSSFASTHDSGAARLPIEPGRGRGVKLAWANVCWAMPTNRFVADKDIIRAELEKRARARQTITYGQAAALVKRTARGLGPILNAIKIEEAGRHRPDLGCLVVAVRTGLPSYVKEGQDAHERAVRVQEDVFTAWASAERKNDEA